MHRTCLNALLSCALLWFATASAQMVEFTGTTLVGDALATEGFDTYGDHIAASEDWLMVGAPREDVDLDGDGIVDSAQGDVDVGAVYVYRRNGDGSVTLHSKLVGVGNNKGGLGDRLGAGLTLMGNTLFVGAANDANFPGFIDPMPDPDFGEFFFAGQVYVYNYIAEIDEWVRVQILRSDEPNSSGSFGARSDASHVELFSFGDATEPSIALIGELENGSGSLATLHVFRRIGDTPRWVRIQKIAPPSGSPDAAFADYVRRAGRYALVDEYLISEDGVTDPTAVHVYLVTPAGIRGPGGTTSPLQTLRSPNEPNNIEQCGLYHFGYGAAAVEDIAVITDPCDNLFTTSAGAAYVYRVDQSNLARPLALTQVLFSPNAVENGLFGSVFADGAQNIALDGELLAIGTARLFAGGAQDDVHVWQRDSGADTFSLVDSVLSPSPGVFESEGYGQAVALMPPNQLAIGQLTDGVTGLLFGRVFLFDIVAR